MTYIIFLQISFSQQYVGIIVYVFQCLCLILHLDWL